jgi:hypothetical protein
MLEDAMHALRIASLSVVAVAAAWGCGSNPDGPSQTNSRMTFFVSSATSMTGNVGGLRGADATCQRLAAAVGAGGRSWRAYLSADQDPDNGNRPTDARSRIGTGRWVNVNGMTVASSLAELHGRTGNADVFITEQGQRVNGQWAGSPSPVEHDILTGSNADGTLIPGLTCNSWSAGAADVAGQVGHSDGRGPGGSTAGALASWNSAHASASCSDTATRGGDGRLYCFARN